MSNSEIVVPPPFRSQTRKVILSIVLFALVYLILLILALALTIACVAGGFWIIYAKPRFITIIMGLGLASLGVLVLFFLVKFMLKTYRHDRSQLIEITAADEPQLFQMIEELVATVGTQFPKKVYLSAEVNAAVFFNSGFWSMFLPVRKNLQIGVGLLNSVTCSELKAILAHEFGHFSQRSMKVGSYVYNVNQVIFNMLFDNDSYAEGVEKFARLNGFFEVIVSLAMRINQGIQFILRSLYRLINKSYFALSREMEFHADEIAAHVTGYEPLVNSLLRMPLAQESLQQVMRTYYEKVEDRLRSGNMYAEQAFIMHHLAEENQIRVQEGLAAVAADSFQRFNQSKLVIEDQWASHPSTEERIARLEGTGLTVDALDNQLAASLLQKWQVWNEAFTEIVFREGPFRLDFKALSLTEFQQIYQEEVDKVQYPELYGGYYDHKHPFPFALEEAAALEQKGSPEDFFSVEMVDLVYALAGIEQDIATLEQIDADPQLATSFDYDGKRYSSKESKALVGRLIKEKEALRTKLTVNDRNIYRYFLGLEQKRGNSPQLTALYQNYFNYDQEFESKMKVHQRITHGLRFTQAELSSRSIQLNFKKLTHPEAKFKKAIKEVLANPHFGQVIKTDMRNHLEDYISKNLTYFLADEYVNSDLEKLYTALNVYHYILSQGYELHARALASYQADLI